MQFNASGIKHKNYLFPSSPANPQSRQEVSRRLAARLTRKTFSQYCPVYFEECSCNFQQAHPAQAKTVRDKCFQNKGKPKEATPDLCSIACILQLYFFVHFLAKLLMIPLKMLPGMWPFEWEGGCKDRMREPCKPASYRCFLSVHSSLLALNAWFIRLK